MDDIATDQPTSAQSLADVRAVQPRAVPRASGHHRLLGDVHGDVLWLLYDSRVGLCAAEGRPGGDARTLDGHPGGDHRRAARPAPERLNHTAGRPSLYKTLRVRQTRFTRRINP